MLKRCACVLVLRSPANLLTVSDTVFCTMIVSEFIVQSVLKCTGSILVSFSRIIIYTLKSMIRVSNHTKIRYVKRMASMGQKKHVR